MLAVVAMGHSVNALSATLAHADWQCEVMIVMVVFLAWLLLQHSVIGN